MLKNMWGLCSLHFGQLRPVTKRLAVHHVPTPMVLRLLADPSCFNDGCGRNLFVPARSVRGDIMVILRVDHDHNCCPGAHSCGKCVRGLLCDPCNFAAGNVGDSAERAEGLARYIRGYLSAAPA